MAGRAAARLSLLVALSAGALIYMFGPDDGRPWSDHAADLFIVVLPLWGGVYNLIAARQPGEVRPIELAGGGDGPPSEPIFGPRTRRS